MPEVIISLSQAPPSSDENNSIVCGRVESEQRGRRHEGSFTWVMGRLNDSLCLTADSTSPVQWNWYLPGLGSLSRCQISPLSDLWAFLSHWSRPGIHLILSTQVFLRTRKMHWSPLIKLPSFPGLSPPDYDKVTLVKELVVSLASQWKWEFLPG